MQQVLGCSVSYRIAVGPQRGRKVFTLQTIPAWEDDDRFTQVAKVSGFSLHAGVAAQAWERQKLERLVRYITRPAVSAQHHRAMTWAQRLKRVFNIDVSVCPKCGGEAKVVASIEDQAVIDKIPSLGS